MSQTGRQSENRCPCSERRVMISFTVLMLPFIVTRVKMRLQMKVVLGTDDYIIGFASVCVASNAYYISVFNLC